MSVLGNNLDKINDQLDGITGYIDMYVNNFEGKSQDYVDEQMVILSNDISNKLNNIKNIQLVPPLHVQYENATDQIAVLQPYLTVIETLSSLSPTDLGEVISALEEVRDALVSMMQIVIAPYYPAVEFIVDIAPKIIELNNNIQTVATYQPTIPGVDIPALDIDISLTLQDIIDG